MPSVYKRALSPKGERQRRVSIHEKGKDASCSPGPEAGNGTRWLYLAATAKIRFPAPPPHFHSCPCDPSSTGSCSPSCQRGMNSWQGCGAERRVCLPGALWVREASPGIQSWDYRDPKSFTLSPKPGVWCGKAPPHPGPDRIGALTLFSHPASATPESLHGEPEPTWGSEILQKGPVSVSERGQWGQREGGEPLESGSGVCAQSLPFPRGREHFWSPTPRACVNRGNPTCSGSKTILVIKKKKKKTNAQPHL